MTDTNVFQLTQPGTFADPLTEVLRSGARALLAQAVEAEVAALLSLHADKLTDDGRARLVRHGHLPEREIMTGIGPVAVRCPRVRDRVGEGSERIRFSSAILPPYARRSKSLEVLIPVLYLQGASPPETSRRRWSHCSARTPADCRPQPSGGSRRPGRRSMRAGASVISQPSATYTSGSTASMCRPGSRMPRSVSWSSSVSRPRGRRSWSA